MQAIFRREATVSSIRAAFRRVALLFICFVAVHTAHAVIVRGTVTDSRGAVIPNARVQLVQGKSVVANTTSGPDGTFEIRSTAVGRFIVLTSANSFAPNIDGDFYGGRTEVINREIVMAVAAVHADITVTATGTPTPVEQASSAVSLISRDALITKTGIVDEMRQQPGVVVVQQGQAGGITSLFVRGGPSDSNKVLVDGVPANDVGGIFDFGTVSSTAVNSIETYRGADSAIYGSDASASVVSLVTPRGMATRPQVDYSGDAGNFHSYRNEVQLAGARQKLDYFGAFSRFETANALQYDQYHSATTAGNIGYQLAPRTLLRLTAHNAFNAQGLPSAHDFFAISSNGRQHDHELYVQGTLENTTLNAWHNLVRYGVARKNIDTAYFGNPGTPISVFGFTEYFGNNVTIRGANGYTASGQASFIISNNSLSNHRDELYYQSDKAFTKHLTGLFGFRYEKERGVTIVPDFFEDHRIQRTNFEYTFGLTGDIKNRVFYSVGGAIEKNHLYGVAGTPRIGLTWIPVSSSNRLFRGTKLRANFAKGVREPSLSDQFSSLYEYLNDSGNQATIAAYHVTPLGPTRSRTYDIGIDQNIFGQKLVFRLGYFHNQYDHQIDFIDPNTLKVVFGINSGLSNSFGAELNSQAFRAQGIESELEWQPFSHIFVRGGYTYLDAVVEQSFSTDAAYNGTSTTNPNLPGVAIGSTYPLVGARPFRRPPHTGYFKVQYNGEKFGAALQGAMASRSDDSTFLSFSDVNGDNTLLLPNRDLDFGYAKLDINGTYNFTTRIKVFAQLDNLLSQQHIGPIGYPALPFTVRAGMKFRLGGD